MLPKRLLPALHIAHRTRRVALAKRGRRGSVFLRSLLGMFDLTGEPIPPELRRWSAESRFQKPPLGPRGKPGQKWLRDRSIIHTVATLAYLTGRDPTRNDSSEAESSMRRRRACIAGGRKVGPLLRGRLRTCGLQRKVRSRCWNAGEIRTGKKHEHLLRPTLGEFVLSGEEPDCLTGESRTGGKGSELNRGAHPLCGEKIRISPPDLPREMPIVGRDFQETEVAQ